MSAGNITRHTMLLLLIAMRTVTASLDTETDATSSEVEKQFTHTLSDSSVLHDEPSFESGAGARIPSLLAKLLLSFEEHSKEDMGESSVSPAVKPLLDAVYSTEDALNGMRPGQDAEDERRSGTEDGRLPPVSEASDVTEDGRLPPVSEASDDIEKATAALLLSLQYAGSILSNPSRSSKEHPVPDRYDQIKPRLSNDQSSHKLNSDLQTKRRFGLTEKRQVEFELNSKRLFDHFANILLGTRGVFSADMPDKKRSFDSLANNLIGKRGVFSVDRPYKRKPFDSLANNLIGKRGVFSVDSPYKRKPFDSLANNLIGKRGVLSVDSPYKRKPFDSLANNLIGKRGVFSVNMPYKRRPFDPLAGGLIGKR